MGFLLTDAYMRNFTGALDASCVQSTKAALQTYMYSDATCYAGQVVAVVSDTTAAYNGLYLITTNPNFKSGTAKSASNSPFNAVQYSSAAAVETAITNMAGVLKFMGVLPSGSSLTNTMCKKGYAWLVTTETGAALPNNGGNASYCFFDENTTLEVGDLVICISGDTERSFLSSNYSEFAVINKNIARSVSSSSDSTTDAEIVVYDGTDGRKVKKGGQTLAALKSECKNLANATGTLPISKGGTGATTLAGAKTALGIDTLETALQNLTGGGSSAASATKLATARSLAFNHPVLGSLSEYKSNTFDGSKNMAALAIDGVYTGTSIPTEITTNFAEWAYAGTAYTLSDTIREYVKVSSLATGSGCGTICKQLSRFNKAYIDGSNPIALKQLSGSLFVGETLVSGKPYLVSFCVLTVSGTSTVMQILIEMSPSSLDSTNFPAIMDELEHEFGNLGNIFPVGTKFVNPATGTTYIYNGYASNSNKFTANTWQ